MFSTKRIERAQRYGFFAARPLPRTDKCPPKGEKAKIPPHHRSKPRKMRTFALDENSADRTTTRRRLLHPGVQAELCRDLRHRPHVRSAGLPPGRMGRRRPSVRNQYLHRHRKCRPPRAQPGAGSAAPPQGRFRGGGRLLCPGQSGGNPPQRRGEPGGGRGRQISSCFPQTLAAPRPKWCAPT